MAFPALKPILLFLLSILSLISCTRPAGENNNNTDSVQVVRPSGPLPDAGKHRGVSWVAAGPVDESHFQSLVENHVDWIVQTPFGWQKTYRSPSITLVTGGRVYWGERDVGLEATTRIARDRGIRTLLKPHLWITRMVDGKWRTAIEMDSEEDWQRWFASYRTFILHYAKLAERNGMEALCIGTELHIAARDREADWRRLIAEIRGIYRGKLLYAANWYREFEEIRFWDELDYIGIQAYFPLTEKENPTVEELKRGWQPHLDAIERVQKKFDKPILFTEVGYRSVPEAAIEPWKWPDHREPVKDDQGFEIQARCYRAFFEVFWDQPWFAGAYFWKWFPRVDGDDPRRAIGFTPQDKQAERILGSWYGKSAE